MLHFESRRKLSIYTSLVALMIIVVYNILRIGIDFQLTESAKTAGFILFLLNFPLLLIETITVKGKIKILQDEYSWIFILLIICCLLSMLPVEMGYFFVVLGALCFFRNIQLYIKIINRKEIIPFIFLTLIAIWLSITVWKRDYLHPMLLERATFHIDTLFHISIAQMIKTYSIPSTGLSGIPFLHYHFGSHFIFACLSKVMNIHLFTFYQLAYPAIFLPLFMKCLLGASIIWSERNTKETQYQFGFWLWMIIAGALIGVFPLYKILVKAALGLPSIAISESYSLSMIFLFLIINILAFNCHYQKAEFIFRVPTLAIILPLIFLLGLTKNSTLCIFNLLALYAFIRLRLFKQKTTVLFGVLVILLSLLCLFITIDPKFEDGSFELFHFYKNYVQLSVPQFIFVYYFWSILLITLCVIMVVFNKKNNLTERNLLYHVLIESVLLMCIVGALPGIFLNIAGGSAGYFMDIQIWIALALILMILPEFFEAVSGSIKNTAKNYIRPIVAGSLIIIALYVAVITQRNFKSTLKLFVEYSLEDKRIMCGDTLEPFKDLSYIEKLTKIAELNSRIAGCLSKNADYNILKQLYQLDTLSLKEKANTMLVLGDISSLSQKYPCYKYPFFLPSLTGIAMKNGYVFEDCGGRNYSFEYYKREDLQTNRNIPTASKDVIVDIKSDRVTLHPSQLKK